MANPTIGQVSIGAKVKNWIRLKTGQILKVDEFLLELNLKIGQIVVGAKI